MHGLNKYPLTYGILALIGGAIALLLFRERLADPDDSARATGTGILLLAFSILGLALLFTWRW